VKASSRTRGLGPIGGSRERTPAQGAQRGPTRDKIEAEAGHFLGNSSIWKMNGARSQAPSRPPGRAGPFRRQTCIHSRIPRPRPVWGQRLRPTGLQLQLQVTPDLLVQCQKKVWALGLSAAKTAACWSGHRGEELMKRIYVVKEICFFLGGGGNLPT